MNKVYETGEVLERYDAEDPDEGAKVTAVRLLEKQGFWVTLHKEEASPEREPDPRIVRLQEVDTYVTHAREVLTELLSRAGQGLHFRADAKEIVRVANKLNELRESPDVPVPPGYGIWEGEPGDTFPAKAKWLSPDSIWMDTASTRATAGQVYAVPIAPKLVRCEIYEANGVLFYNHPKYGRMYAARATQYANFAGYEHADSEIKKSNLLWHRNMSEGTVSHAIAVWFREERA